MKIKSIALLLSLGALSSDAISLKSSTMARNRDMLLDEQIVEGPVQDDANAQVEEAPPAAEEQQQQEVVEAPQPEAEQVQQTEQIVQPGEVEQDQQVQQEAQVDQGAEAEAQAQAEAEAQALAEQQAQEQAAPVKKPVVSNVADPNQAAAVAAAANELFPDVAKMKPAEKKAYQAKKAREAQLEKQRLKEKEERENPTVDENGEHIQTVAEAKQLAAEMQAQLEAGEQAVEEKIAMHQAELAAEPAQADVPVKQEEDDGHVETVEEVKARMAQLQAGMDQGLQETDQRVEQMTQENADMPDFGALANMQGTISHMGKMRKSKQMQDIATKLGVELAPGEEELSASDLTSTLMQRAKEAGKTDDEINQLMSE